MGWGRLYLATSVSRWGSGIVDSGRLQDYNPFIQIKLWRRKCRKKCFSKKKIQGDILKYSCFLFVVTKFSVKVLKKYPGSSIEGFQKSPPPALFQMIAIFFSQKIKWLVQKFFRTLPKVPSNLLQLFIRTFQNIFTRLPEDHRNIFYIFPQILWLCLRNASSSKVCQNCPRVFPK